MKPVAIAASILSACVIFTGCSAGGSATTSAPAETAAAPAAAAQESAPAAATADSDYAVTIDGSSQAKDYEGKPALVVDYTFTNNSDKATSFIVAIGAKAFQQGVELEMAMLTDAGAYDAALGLKEIKPGATTKVQTAYVLADESEVTIEVEESFSFSDDLIATQTIALT